MLKLFKISLVGLLFCLTSCFDHDDTFIFHRSGAITMYSTIEITDDEIEKKEVKLEIAKLIKELEDEEGWNIIYKWTKKSKPYKIEFTSTNTIQNLHELHQSPDAYGPAGVFVESKPSESRYIISFEKLENANNRDIRILGSPLFKAGDNELVKVKNIVDPRTSEYFLVILDQ